MNVQDRVAIVTGGGQGIGAAIAERLAANGARVAVLDINRDAANKGVDKILSQGGSALAVQCDVTQSASVDAAVAQVVEWGGGRLDILVNNVGIIRDGYLAKMSEEAWDQVIGVNLKSAFLAMHAAVPKMIEAQYGRIVTISSRAWLGNVGQANYSASKGGLVSLTRTAALELGRFNITANVVAPGVIDTPMYQGLKPEVQEKLKATQPIRRIGTPAEVAYAVHFLASDEAWYITGQVLYVCGGKSVGIVG